MKKNDNVWAEIGGIIENDLLADLPEDYENIEIPKELDEKMLKFAKAVDTANAEKARRARKKKYLQICASVIIVVTLAGTVTISSVDSLRTKYFGFFIKQNEGNVEITPKGDERGLLADWSGYWYPGYLPEDFELTGVDKTFETRTMLFENEDSAMVISLSQQPTDAQMGVDIDTNEMSEIDINGYKGYLFIDKTNKNTVIIWMMSDVTFYLQLEESIDSDMAVKIAEHIKYVA